MDFKAQILKDLKVFNNPAEFAEVVNIWYDGKTYTVTAIIDHTAAEERKRLQGDNAEGISSIETLVYISQDDLGFIPKRGMEIEIEEAGAVNTYLIQKSNYEDGEIILELGAYAE